MFLNWIIVNCFWNVVFIYLKKIKFLLLFCLNENYEGFFYNWV